VVDEVSWLPGQILDRNAAVTAMLLTGIAGQGDLPDGHRLWPTSKVGPQNSA
jgi:hypothetical protein